MNLLAFVAISLTLVISGSELVEPGSEPVEPNPLDEVQFLAPGAPIAGVISGGDDLSRADLLRAQALGFLSPTSDGTTGAACDRVVSTSGNDSNRGTASAPWKTTIKAVAAYQPGEIVCFRAGVYNHSTHGGEAGQLRVTRSGTASNRVVFRSYPGEMATITGRVVVDGSYVTIENLKLRDEHIDGTPSWQIFGDYVTFQNNDMSNGNRHIGLQVSTQDTGEPSPIGWKILHNRIHDNGRLPYTNKDHGFYISKPSGPNGDQPRGEVAFNIYEWNADRGVQFYPDGDGHWVHHNVIVYNRTGVSFGSADVLEPGGQICNCYSQDNLIENNVIAYNDDGTNTVAELERSGNNIHVGTKYALDRDWGNEVNDNCLVKIAGLSNQGTAPGIQYRTSGNTVTDKNPFINKEQRDFRIVDSSPCKSIIGAQTIGPLAEFGGTPGGSTQTPTPTPIGRPTPVPTVDHGSGIEAPPVGSIEKAKGRPASASSVESGTAACAYANDCAADKAVDADASVTGSRWSSEFLDGARWQVDLGSIREVERVYVTWFGNSWAPSYSVQTSTDAIIWTTAAVDRATKAGARLVKFAPRDARYVRLQSVDRAGPFGVSITDVKIYGGPDDTGAVTFTTVPKNLKIKVQGGSPAVSYPVTVYASGSGSFRYEMAEDSPYVTLSKTSGTVPANGFDTVIVTIRPPTTHKHYRTELRVWPASR